MKPSIIYTFIFCILLSGCTIPCEIFFRNLTNEPVVLNGKLVNRRYFDKLPNTVNFYDTAQKAKDIYGTWQYQRLVTWTDSVHFHIDIPAHMVIDVSDVSNGLTLGSKLPDVLLVVTSGGKADTITTGDYPSVAAKFKEKRSVFSKPVYYYDWK